MSDEEYSLIMRIFSSKDEGHELILNFTSS